MYSLRQISAPFLPDLIPGVRSLDRRIARLERAEARNALACAVARCRLHGFDAQYRRIGGGYVIYAGHWTHLTQGLAMGVSREVTPRDVWQVSRFFRRRLAIPTVHVCDVIPHAVDRFISAGYRERGSWNILARSLHPRDSHDLPHISPGERFTSADWIRACGEGFLSKTELDPDDLEIGTIVTNAAHAERFGIRCAEGQLKGTAAMTCRSGVALLFADSTRPKYRGQRVQSALISSRLAHARAAGCDLAMCVVEPGSQSERNYLRGGFRRIYRRVTLQQID